MFTGLSLLRANEKKPVELSEEAKARQEYLKKYAAGGVCFAVNAQLAVAVYSRTAHADHICTLNSEPYKRCGMDRHCRPTRKEEKEKEASKDAGRHPHYRPGQHRLPRCEGRARA